MKKMTIFILPFVFMLNCGCLYNYELENITYSGHVYKKSDSSPLSGITVELNSSNDRSSPHYTNTDINGYYNLSIDVDCRGGSVTLAIFAPDEYIPIPYFYYSGSDGARDACNPPVLDVFLELRP